MKQKKARQAAYCGMLTALAMIFSYIEVLIPFSVGMFGMKLGLANLVVLSGLYWMNHRDVFLVSMVRIFLSTLLFGNVMALFYSLAGGILSFLIMSFLQKKTGFSVWTVSLAGGLCHNLGQLAVAYVILGSGGVFYYFPVLMVSGILAGLIIGVLTGRILSILQGKVSYN